MPLCVYLVLCPLIGRFQGSPTYVKLASGRRTRSVSCRRGQRDKDSVDAAACGQAVPAGDKVTSHHPSCLCRLRSALCYHGFQLSDWADNICVCLRRLGRSREKCGAWGRQVLALFTAQASLVKDRGKLLLWPSVKLRCWEMPGISRPPPGPGLFSELPGGTPANCISWSRWMCTEKQGIASGRLYFHAVVQGKDLTLPSVQ